MLAGLQTFSKREYEKISAGQANLNLPFGEGIGLPNSSAVYIHSDIICSTFFTASW
jgi:hypothetical protein